jgi:hypothetical protein
VQLQTEHIFCRISRGSIYVNRLPLLANRNEFAGMSTEAPLDDSYLKRIHAKQITMVNIREYNSAMTFASVGTETQLPTGNSPYSFRIHCQIYQLVSQPYLNEANNAGYGQLRIFYSAEATAKVHEN